jgi:hypothetical protein
MKIFAKRKRTLEGAADPGIAETKTDPDAAIQEILKQDPSTWNAKQRRLVKRFEERTQSSVISLPVAGTATETIESPVKVDASPPNVAQDAVAAPADGGSNAALHPESNSLATDPDAKVPSKNIGAMLVDAELQGILDQLNSKQRRTLVRQLERGGQVEAVRLEATRWLQEGAAQELPAVVEAPAVEAPEPPRKKPRLRRPTVDPSLLTPEERLRRDEQRRRQQVAAAARQTSPSHLHPLNSERRRANRRKPKWEAPPRRSTSSRPPNEHDASGYHLRKIIKAER